MADKRVTDLRQTAVNPHTMRHGNALSGQGVNSLVASNGVAPYGLRYGGDTPAREISMPKGLGYFGLLRSTSGYPMTEFSASENIDGANVQFPLIVPTLTREELDWLLAGNDPTESIYQKAIAHAIMRTQSNLSPFAQQSELRYPVPKK